MSFRPDFDRYFGKISQGRVQSYRPEGIVRYGVQEFLEERAARIGDFQIPPLHFTEEENRLTDEILAQERYTATDGV